MATFETQNDQSSLLSKRTSSKSKWSTLQCVSFSLLLVVISVLASNMDRIVTSLQNNNGDAQQVDGTYDIIVVGAGPAGLLHTHLLQEYNPDSNILLIEQLNRTGGRQFSSTISYKGGEPLTFEQCAMRTRPFFVWTLRLLNYLDLCDYLVPFAEYADATKTVWSSRNSFVFQSDRDADFFINNYNLLPLEQSYLQTYTSPLAAVVDLSLRHILNENQKPNLPQTPREWNEFRNEWTLDGKILNGWSFSELCRFLNLSKEFQEAATLLSVLPEEHQFFYLWSLSSSNESAFASQNTSFYTLSSGYDTMSRELASKITEHDADSLLLGNKVVAVEKQTNDKYIVTTSQDKQFRTDKVILSVPAHALQAMLANIEPFSDDEYTKTMIEGVGSWVVACKLNLVFDNILLNDMVDESVLFAMSASDAYSQNIGQILFESNWFQGNLSVITFYIYMPGDCPFWWNLQQSTQYDLYDQHLDDIEMDEIDDSIIASKAVVIEAVKQFKKFMSNSLVNITEINMPIIGFMSVWGADPAMGASIESPKIGVNADELLANIVHPMQDEEIYIASSSFSWNAQFVEGAIQATMQNLQQNFGIPSSALRDVDSCAL